MEGGGDFGKNCQRPSTESPPRKHWGAGGELWGGCVLVDPTLSCVAPSGEILEIPEMVRRYNTGKLAGFPDVIGVFPDGRVALREAKCVDAKDRLNAPQHKLADLLRSLLGDKPDLNVVEWGAMVEDGEA